VVAYYPGGHDVQAHQFPLHGTQEQPAKTKTFAHLHLRNTVKKQMARKDARPQRKTTVLAGAFS
jgi:7-keto-8-aminopelargonate synthetase-like enzyme